MSFFCFQIDEVLEEGIGDLKDRIPILLVMNKKDLIKPGEIAKKLQVWICYHLHGNLLVNFHPLLSYIATAIHVFFFSNSSCFTSSVFSLGGEVEVRGRKGKEPMISQPVVSLKETILFHIDGFHYCIFWMPFEIYVPRFLKMFDS